MFSPNILNWPKHVPKLIENAFKKVFEKRNQEATANSMRSMIQAPEGYCIVDSDLDTAEVISLAYLSQDDVMIAACNGKDTDFIQIDPKEAELKGLDVFWFKKKPFIRLSSYETRAFSAKLLKDNQLIDASDAKKIAVLNDKGDFIHPKRDLHWELSETAFERPRETMEDEQERKSGKVGNFCIAQGELVLTNYGLVPIEYIRSYHKLWDGVDFVSHGGILYKGYGWVSYYDSLWATDGHIVWDKNGNKTQFKTASLEQTEICRTQNASGEPTYTGFENISGHSKARRRGLLLSSNRMRTLRKNMSQRFKKYGKRLHIKVSMPEKVSRQKSDKFRSTICSNGTALQERHSRKLSQLLCKRNTSVIRIQRTFHTMGSGKVSKCGLKRIGFRQNRQRRSLQPRQFTLSRPYNKSIKYENYKRYKRWVCKRLFKAQSKCDIYRTKDSSYVEKWIQRARNFGISREECLRKAQNGYRWTKVYDILNAGPRHRFTCSGCLVSNSIPYGATGALLEMMIEAETGKKPEAGTGDKLIEGYNNKWKKASIFLSMMGDIVKDPGYYRAPSGKIRHFNISKLTLLDGISQSAYDSILSSLTREARNFPIKMQWESKKVNCWKPLRALATTTYLETESVNV